MIKQLSIPVLLTSILLCGTNNSLAGNNEAKLKLSGDIRAGYFTLHRDDRDGSTNYTDELRLRVRAGLGMELSDSISAKVRFAGR